MTATRHTPDQPDDAGDRDAEERIERRADARENFEHTLFGKEAILARRRAGNDRDGHAAPPTS